MPPITMHQSSTTTKLLFIGDSGAGKTGALASLVSEGYNVRILDLDNGADILKSLLSPGTRYNAAKAANLEVVTVTDKMRNVNGKLVQAQASVWPRAIKLLDRWKYDYVVLPNGTAEVLWSDKAAKDAREAGQEVHTIDYGPITEWTPQDVLVIDSLTFLSNAALDYVQGLEGRLGQRPQLQDWGAGQSLIENLMEMLYDENVRCNVIVMCHITYLEVEGGMSKGYPNTLGKALPPKIARYFNTVLMARTLGPSRKIFTKPQAGIELKNSAPTKVKESYELETGLADYFKAVRG